MNPHTNLNLLPFRSKKYSTMMLETTPAPPPSLNPPSEPQKPSVEQESTPSLHLSSTQIQPISHPAATSSPQQESLSQTREAPESLDQESGPMLYLSESLQESVTADGPLRPASESDTSTPQKQSQTAVMSDSEELQKEPILGALVESVANQCGSTNPAAAEAAVQQLTKPRKDKLARLKELGLDPPPVAKLCPESVAFVELEPQQLNPGET